MSSLATSIRPLVKMLAELYSVNEVVTTYESRIRQWTLSVTSYGGSGAMLDASMRNQIRGDVPIQAYIEGMAEA